MDTKPEPNYAFYTGAVKAAVDFFPDELYVSGIIDEEQRILIRLFIKDRMDYVMNQAILYAAIHPNH